MRNLLLKMLYIRINNTSSILSTEKCYKQKKLILKIRSIKKDDWVNNCHDLRLKNILTV